MKSRRGRGSMRTGSIPVTTMRAVFFSIILIMSLLVFVFGLKSLPRLQRHHGRSMGGRRDEKSSPTPDAPDGFVRLANGVLMPKLGFGTAGLGNNTQVAVSWALKAGYRLVDSAQAREWYREDLTGAAVKSSGISRSDLFLVSKLHPKHIGYAITRQRFADSLAALNTTYLDLFLLHYPWCFQGICGDNQSPGTWRDSWRALEELYREGLIRAIGVSNFGEPELQQLLDSANVKPHVVQRHSDPFQADRAVRRICAQNHVVYMGYSTLGSQWLMRGFSRSPVLHNPTIISIGKTRGCSTAQVVLKWALESNQVVIPRSSNQGRIDENFLAPRCPLTEGDVKYIDDLDGFEPSDA